MKQEWTERHERMARYLGYSPNWKELQGCAQSVLGLIAKSDSLGTTIHGDDFDVIVASHELRSLASPTETQLDVLKDIRSMVRTIHDRVLTKDQ